MGESLPQTVEPKNKEGNSMDPEHCSLLLPGEQGRESLTREEGGVDGSENADD